MRFAWLMMAALAGAGPALAENRAVVIGNADYLTAPDLAGSDTAALAKALEDAGFTTQQGIDQPSEDMLRTLDILARQDQTPGGRIVALSGRFLHGAGDTWFMGTEAGEPGPLTAGKQGVPISLIAQLVSGAKPGSVLLLGTDEQDMPHQPGLTSGIGDMAEVEGVSVITGSPEAVARAVRELAAGRSVAQALTAGTGLKLLPGGDERLVPVAPAIRPASPAPNPAEADSAAWAEAAEQDSVAGYGAYLDRYPSGLYSAAARERQRQLQERATAANADRDAWALAASQNSAAGYEAYLQRFPQGRYAQAAQGRLAELRPAPAPAPAKPTPQSIEADMALGRDARIAVQRGLSRLGYEIGEFDGVLGSRSRSAILSWQRANRFAESGYLNPAQRKALQEQVAFLDGDNGSRDRAFWLQTGAKGGAAQLRAYLNRYPEGRYAAEASRQLNAPAPAPAPIGGEAAQNDAATWRWARRQDTAAAYDNYLERFPRGAHVTEAAQRRDNLRAGTEAARRDEASLGLNQAARRVIEERLGASGMRPGPVDGEFTDETRDAIRRYQASRNLRVTGYVSQQTAGSLLQDVLRPR